MQSAKDRNDLVVSEVLALIQKTYYGHINLSLDIHNGRITQLKSVISKKVLYDPKQEDKPIKDLLLKIRNSIDDELDFSVGTKNGRLSTLSFTETLDRNYDQLDLKS